MTKSRNLILVINLLGFYQAVSAGIYAKILFVIYQMKKTGACLCHKVFKISCCFN